MIKFLDKEVAIENVIIISKVKNTEAFVSVNKKTDNYQASFKNNYLCNVWHKRFIKRFEYKLRAIIKIIKY